MATVTTSPTLRPKTDRFLIAILFGVVALLLIAGGAVFFSRQSVPQLPADTPGGVVQQFYTAVGQQDYDKAYDLLSDSMIDKPTREAFVRYNLGRSSYGYPQSGDRMRIKSENIRDNLAVVVVEITHYYNNPGPFGGSSQWSDNETFPLSRDASGWRITDLPYMFEP